MNILGIQITTILFGTFMAYFAFLCYKKNYFGIKSLIVWLLLFASITATVLFPNLLSPFAQILKFARLFDLFIVLGLFFLITISFINFTQNQRLKKKIEKIVQHEALEGDNTNARSER